MQLANVCMQGKASKLAEKEETKQKHPKFLYSPEIRFRRGRGRKGWDTGGGRRRVGGFGCRMENGEEGDPHIDIYKLSREERMKYLYSVRPEAALSLGGNLIFLYVKLCHASFRH